MKDEELQKLIEWYQKKDKREDYLKLRLAINKLDVYHGLNELEIKGVRPGMNVYIKQKAIYSCEVLNIQKKKCKIKILDEGSKKDKEFNLAFSRIHLNPSDIGLNNYYNPPRK